MPPTQLLPLSERLHRPHLRSQGQCFVKIICSNYTEPTPPMCQWCVWIQAHKEEYLLLLKEPRQSFRRAASWERGEKCFFVMQQIKRLFFIQMVGGIFEAFRKYFFRTVISDVFNRLLGIYLSKTLMLSSLTLIHKVQTGAQGTLILRGKTFITLKMLV